MVPLPDIVRPSRRQRLSVLGGNGRALAGLAILGTVATAALAAPWLYPGDPLDMVARSLVWPGVQSAHPLGTDALGRDIAAQLAHGARVSLLVGVGSALFALLVGGTVGALAGTLGGWTERGLLRVIELFQTFPAFLLAIALVGVVEPSIPVIIVAIGAVSWAEVARLVRGEYRAWRSRDFVLAAEAVGYGRVRIALTEILPNALPPVIALTPVLIASAILTESGLSFLGLSDPNVVSWGSMIGDGRDYLRSSWYLVALPSAAIALTVLAFNLIGDAVNTHLGKAPRR